jgi:molybdopterin/thiamine biosynthesis adenylyltransferase
MNEPTDLLTGTRYITRLIGSTHPAEAPVHGRDDLVPGFVHSAMRQCSIVSIGAGGLGGEVGYALVRKGVGTLKVCDHDFVELSNLNRQRFFSQDLYKNKALALAKNLAREATHRTEIRGYPFGFQDAVERGVDLSCTLAVCGVDNDATRVYVARYFRALEIPVVFLAVSRDASCGYVFVQETDIESPCFVCLFPDAVNSDETSPCAAGATIDILKVVAGIATYAVDSLIMPRKRTWNYKEVFLAGQIQDGHKRLTKRGDCPLCGQSPQNSPVVVAASV